MSGIKDSPYNPRALKLLAMPANSQRAAALLPLPACAWMVAGSWPELACTYMHQKRCTAGRLVPELCVVYT